MKWRKIANMLAASGYSPIPIRPKSKIPSIRKWQSIDCDGLLDKWPEDNGVGIRTGGGIIAIDIDVYDHKIVSEIFNRIRYFFGTETTFASRVGLYPKLLIPAYCEEVESKLVSNAWIDNEERTNRIEILSSGQQFVAYGIHPDTGKYYQWNEELYLCHLPAIRLDQISELFDLFGALAAGAGLASERKVKQSSRSSSGRDNISAERRQAGNTVGRESPVEYYNRTVGLDTVLKAYGWTHFRDKYWTRPGKKSGISGAVNKGMLYCFTSSTCLSQGKCYDAFEIAAMYSSFAGDKAGLARLVKARMLEAQK